MTIKQFISIAFFASLSSCTNIDDCYYKYPLSTNLSVEILENADQIFITSDSELILISNIAENLKYNFHVFNFDKTQKLKGETHISATFIDSMVNNMIYANYHRIEGWAMTEERSCNTDTLGKYKISLNNCKWVGGGRHVGNLIDSIFIDTSYMVHIDYRIRPKSAYYFIDNIKDADSILTKKQKHVFHINNLNFEYGTKFSVRHYSIDSVKNELYVTHEYFIPKNDRIMANFYQQVFELTKK